MWVSDTRPTRRDLRVHFNPRNDPAGDTPIDLPRDPQAPEPDSAAQGRRVSEGVEVLLLRHQLAVLHRTLHNPRCRGRTRHSSSPSRPPPRLLPRDPVPLLSAPARANLGDRCGDRQQGCSHAGDVEEHDRQAGVRSDGGTGDRRSGVEGQRRLDVMPGGESPGTSCTNCRSTPLHQATSRGASGEIASPRHLTAPSDPLAPRD
jgi:hypothetical protein